MGRNKAFDVLTPTGYLTVLATLVGVLLTAFLSYLGVRKKSDADNAIADKQATATVTAAELTEHQAIRDDLRGTIIDLRAQAERLLARIDRLDEVNANLHALNENCRAECEELREECRNLQKMVSRQSAIIQVGTAIALSAPDELEEKG